MNPVDVSARFLLQSRVLLGVAVLLSLVSFPMQMPRWGKAIATGSAGLVLVSAWVQRRQYDRYSRMAGVYSEHETMAYGQFLRTTSDIGLATVTGMWDAAQAQLAPAQAALLPSAETFDWQRFNTEPDTYAHLAIVGPTGSGKSTLAEALATQLGGITMAIAPHRKPGDFKALGDRVYCGGRNYGTKNDDPADFQALLQGTGDRVSVVSVIKAVFEEMDRRYQLLDSGQDTGDFVNVIWDETLAALDECPKALVPLMLKLLRESRKVGIRLILLPPDDAVKSLHLDGQGAARANLSYVRLKSTAIAHATKLEKTQKGILQMVQSQRRPCLVEDVPAIVPEYNPNMVTVPAEPTQSPPSLDELNALFDLKEPVIIGAEKDEELLIKIQEFGADKKEVTASQLKRNVNALKKPSVDEINSLLTKLVDRGVGALKPGANPPKWLPPPTTTNGTNSQ
ncbi:MAG: hypothetical protein ACFCBU_01355 [Cyanophyceae cyanobacterium]